MAEQKTKISQSELESEFGLEGNTPAPESDAVAEGKDPDAAAETVDAGGVDTKTIERSITREEALAGLDDNLARMEKEEELDAAEAAEDAAEAEEELEEEPDEELEDDAGEDEEEAGEEEEAPEEEEDPAKAENEDDAEEEEGEEELTPYQEWVRENLEDESEREALMDALIREGAQVTYNAGGQQVTESLEDVVRKAAGYSGEEEVSRRSQALKAKAQEIQQQAEQAKEMHEVAEETLRNFTQKVDNPEEFGSWLADRADPEYLQVLQQKINGTLEMFERDPAQFQMNRRLASIEEAIRGQGGRAEDGSRDAVRPDEDAEPAAGDPGIPDDLGFSPGRGYPERYTAVALREARSMLDAATAAGVDTPSLRDVVDTWKREKRARPVADVARSLIEGRKRDAPKREIALDPPSKRKPKSSRKRSGKKKPSGDRRQRTTAPDWDAIPSRVEDELRSLQGDAELAS